MTLKGVTYFLLLASFIFVFQKSLGAAYLNSNSSPTNLDELTTQKCQSVHHACKNLPIYLLPSMVLDSGQDKRNSSDRFWSAPCCQAMDSVFGAFSFHFMLNDYTLGDFGDNDSWTVLSSLVNDAEPDNGVQNEIDLSVIDVDAETEESQPGVLTNNHTDLVDKTNTSHAFKQRPIETIAIWDFSGQPVRFDFFADINDRNCQTPSDSSLAGRKIGYPIPDIPVYTNKKIEAFIRLYTKKKRSLFIKAINRLPIYEKMISDTLVEHQLPLNLAYLAIVESNLNPKARSTANAVGLWQFMSYTGKHFGLSRSWWHDDRYDPERSTIAAAKYLKQLHKQFKGDWELALAAYNSGPTTVRRAIRNAKRKGKPTDYWSLRLPRETRGYVPAFYAVGTIFSDLEKYGFKPVEPTILTKSKQQLGVGGGITLNQVAKIFGLKPQVLFDMNPRLKFRGLTPPTYDSFEIALPASVHVTGSHLHQLEGLKKNRHEEWKIHKVRQGETLWSISRYYRIPMKKILTYNRLRKRSLLRIGQKLMLPVPIDWNPPKTLSKTQLAVSDMNKIPGVTKIHVVQKGETLWQISQKYNVSIRKIRYWNRRVLSRKYLKIGTEIVLKLPVSLASSSI